jgi:hypothetical protein
MRTSDESIREEIEACGPRRRGRRISAGVRERVVAHATAELGNGRSRLGIARALGISDQTLARWLSDGVFVPVQIETDRATSAFVAVSPGGWRVEGLQLEELAELLRRTS